MSLHIDWLNKRCIVCGQLNRFHKVFFCPDRNYYVRQAIDKDFFDEPLVTDHRAIVDNLEYLEYLDETKTDA
jgi:hypothetical protein